MEKTRGVRALSIVALVAAVLGLTVAFAAMSRTLTISGTATMDTAKWDIHFEDVNGNKYEGTDVALTAHVTPAPGGATVPTPDTAVISGLNAISGINMTVTKPGDYVYYDFYIVNEGTIDAKITNLTKQLKPTCTSAADPQVAADATLVCGNLTYSFVYLGAGDTEGSAVSEDDTLAKANGNTPTKRKVRLKLAYDGETLPTDDVNLSNMGFSIEYTQN